ncbi:SPOR domain-containing protein [Ferrovibrio sp.]|uniref:SPOR domain-containing protein n=1 Tax=Ferrovibrio sp. TaxID=1917215 RepID=UPI003D122406
MPYRPAAAALILVLLLAGCSGLKADADKPAELPVAAALPVDLPPPPVMEVKAEPMPAPPPPPVAPPPVPRFAGHVASFKNQGEAERGWVALSKRFSILQGLTPRYVEVDLGGSRGKTVRVLLGGFIDRDGARAYCYDMRREGLFCAPHSLPNSGPLPNAG